MRFTLLSKEGKLAPLGHKLKAEGYQVRLYVRSAPFKKVAGGLLETPGFTTSGDILSATKEWQPDLVVVEDGLEELGEQVKGLGLPVFGSSLFSMICREQPRYYEQLLQSVGVSGDRGGVDYGWWNGSSFTMFWRRDENRGFMNGGVGVDMVSALVVKLERFSELTALESVLRKVEHRGVFSLAGGGRCGLCVPELLALASITKEGLGELLLGRADPSPILFGSVARVSCTPFPHGSPREVGPLRPGPLVVPEKGRQYFHPEDTDEGGPLGLSGRLGWVSARGDSVGECRSRLYRTIGGMEIEGLQYRTDMLRFVL